MNQYTCADVGLIKRLTLHIKCLSINEWVFVADASIAAQSEERYEADAQQQHRRSRSIARSVR